MKNFFQSEISRKKNEEYFSTNLLEYQNNIANIDSYHSIMKRLSQEINGADFLLDIGNGGVFDYNVQTVNHIIAVDLFLDKIDVSKYPNNITFKKGSALDIPESNDTFDTAVMVMLIHHIVGETVEINHSNLERCINECYRVIKPGGKLVIVESCIPHFFYKFEVLMYPFIKKIIERNSAHPMAFQYTKNHILSVLQKTFGNVHYENIKKGKYVLQLGVKTPSFLTPVQPYIFVTKKNS